MLRWLLPFALVLASLSLAAEPPGDVEQIRAKRLAYNDAIAERRIEGFAAVLAPDMVEVTSNGTVTRGVKDMAQGYADQEFKNPDFVRYERLPASIEISPNQQVAVERGRWRALNRQGMTRSGVYQAGWVRAADGWRIKTEAYVSLP
ncbi:nuclear transport factor 2 family protein [Pelomonas sp. SE-A7]|uniref:nuclear transport factor 2 family protein n=1 Tax=Pelomonas sp. SE-A7 TaxID=3054953 RepID=UPI00259CA082|nr:nuclear transport factor 2 family protein [Pelomonas sp. SE-A7]MDM4765903.1 nuclear transport factor 2 family protein [Pelomonas sp. SE-A7]